MSLAENDSISIGIAWVSRIHVDEGEIEDVEDIGYLERSTHLPGTREDERL